MNRLLVIGGSDAGVSAAIRAKEINPGIDITLIVADRFPNFSICGLPFFISGEIEDWRSLAHRTIGDIERADIHLRLCHRAEAIDPQKKTVSVTDPDGRSSVLSYDKLVIGTGAVSTEPKISGIDLPGVFLLRWIGDGFALKGFLDEKKPASAVIIGGGYIGMEMADAFRFRGMAVTVVEYADQVLTTLDPELARKVEDTLIHHGVNVATKTPVTAIEKKGNHVRVIGGNGFQAEADVVLVAVGARPNVALASSAGLDIGAFGAIRVNRRMETNQTDIYAAGDCAETWHHLLGRYGYMPLGTTAHKQGRVAGENAAGGNASFQGVLGTQVVKIFDLVTARTGLRDQEARRAGFDPLTTETEVWDHKIYYPDAKRLIIRMTGDRRTQRLLGVQIIGPHTAEVSKRLDILAAALYNGMKMNAISDLDLSYTPPLSSPWDPIQAASQEWMRMLRKDPQQPHPA